MHARPAIHISCDVQLWAGARMPECVTKLGWRNVSSLIMRRVVGAETETNAYTWDVHLNVYSTGNFIVYRVSPRDHL
jgi:hypothetical protein